MGFFSNAGAPQEKPCLYVSSGPSDAHAAWCVCLLNQQAHQGALITGVQAGHRSRGTRRQEPALVRAGCRRRLEAADERIADTIIEIYHKREFLITVAQRFKLLSLFLKVAGSIPGVVNIHVTPFFLAAPAAGEETNPTSTGHAQTPAPWACSRVVPCVVRYLLASLPCTELDHRRAHVSSAHMP